MWYRHNVDSWHLDCEISNEKHDFLAMVTKKDNTLELSIPSSNITKTFNILSELNDFLKQIELETVKIS